VTVPGQPTSQPPNGVGAAQPKRSWQRGPERRAQLAEVAAFARAAEWLPARALSLDDLVTAYTAVTQYPYPDRWGAGILG
jgi:hypothetical protein